MDKRLTQASKYRAPVDEMTELTGQYKSRYMTLYLWGQIDI